MLFKKTRYDARNTTFQWGFDIESIIFMDYRKEVYMSYLIKDTTREEREKIVAESLGNIEANCDGCMPGLAEMYQDYIDGKKELREINMEFNARYVKDNDMEVRGSSCGMGF